MLLYVCGVKNLMVSSILKTNWSIKLGGIYVFLPQMPRGQDACVKKSIISVHKNDLFLIIGPVLKMLI